MMRVPVGGRRKEEGRGAKDNVMAGDIIKGCAYDKGDNCKQAVISIILVNTEKGLVAASSEGRTMGGREEGSG